MLSDITVQYFLTRAIIFYSDRKTLIGAIKPSVWSVCLVRVHRRISLFKTNHKSYV